MKYYIVAGEASGDLHGSNLMRELKISDTKAQFRFWGGDEMQRQGGTLVKHYRDHAFMGIFTVIKNLKTIKNNFKTCEHDLLEYNPDVLILIDYSGFNLRIAEFAKKHDITIFYYISPQLWAWRQSRVKKVKQFVDKMFVILPFEKEFYKKFDYEVEFVGHPLLDAIELRKTELKDFTSFQKDNNLNNKPIIALLPGSRKQEISIKLPIMLSITRYYSNYQFIIAGAQSIDIEFYKNYISDNNVTLLFDKTYQILNHSKAAIVTSGTATLETALHNIPQIVCYKGGTLSYLIVKMLVNIKFISIVNLIMDKEIIKELIQNDLTTVNIKNELDSILKNEDKRKQVIDSYGKLKEKLGGIGASKKAANLMFEMLLKIKNQ